MELNNSIPMVSISCCTYNHEKYIAKALDGMLMQKTNFLFEILVHDDASEDKTQKIIRDYEKKYPGIIKPIYQTENQYSKKVKISINYQYPRAKGKYIALCEGDDYWTDPCKLQKQVEFLESHPEYSMCVHNSERIKESGEFTGIYQCDRDYECDMSMEDIILNHGLFATASMLFRSDCLEEIRYISKDVRLYDYILKFIIAKQGKVYYIPDVMSAYRECANGSWTERIARNPEKYKVHLENSVQALFYLDKYSEYKFTEIFKRNIKRREFDALIAVKDLKAILCKKEYRELFIKEGFLYGLKFCINKYIPFLKKIKGLRDYRKER